MTTDTVDDMNDPQSNDIQEKDEMAVPAATFQEPAAVTDNDSGWGDESSLMPEGAGGPANDEWDEGEAQVDFGDLRINMSAKELNAESFDDLVPGKYIVAITEGKLERSKSANNPGKPMYNLTYKVQDGKFKGAQVYDRLCLWEGAAYSFSMLMKALGIPVTNGMGVPKIQDLIGRVFVMRMGMGKRNVVKDRVTGEEKVYEPRMQVKGYFPAPSNFDQQNVALADPLAP